MSPASLFAQLYPMKMASLSHALEKTASIIKRLKIAGEAQFVTADKLSVGHRGNATAQDDGIYKIESKSAKTLNDLSEFLMHLIT